MDGNLLALIISLVIYTESLGLTSTKKINLKPLAVISILAAFWLGFQWNTWLGILAVFGGIIIGIVVLRLTV